MKPNKKKINNETLLRLIDRYFEGETSLEEERTLRQSLAETDCNDEAVEAARAVMGVFAVQRRIATEKKQAVTSKPRRLLSATQWVAVSAVASVAIIIVAVVSLMNVNPMQQQGMLSVASLTGNHDSIAQLMPSERSTMSKNSVAFASERVNTPESSAEIDALIKSEMGLMAEAQSSVYQSVVSDFDEFSSIMK